MQPTKNFNWIEFARNFIGQKELAGGKSNPWIVSLWENNKWLGDDDSRVPWCGAFVNFVLINNDIKTFNSFYRAKDWLKWGVKLTQPAYGCVVVFERKGGGHVGFVVGRDKAGNLLVLGGNQGDAVSIAAFDPTRVSGFRWPSEIPLSNIKPLAVMNIETKLSTNEV